MEKVDGFFNEFRFLSNFHLCSINFQGKTYPSSEHAYQASKSLHPEIQEEIRLAESPKAAKRIGSKIVLRSDWESIKVCIMLEVLRCKFNQNPELASKLLETGEAELVESNWWRDTFWGVCNGVGQNQLGKLLMQVRKELRAIDK